MEELAEKHTSVAGFEANGGFLQGSALVEGSHRLEALLTRDALLPALTLMVSAARSSKPLSALVEGLPARYTASDRLQAFPTEQSQALLAEWQNNLSAMQQVLALEHDIAKVDTTDGLRVILENDEIVHFRASGNAPELRCYVEAN